MYSGSDYVTPELSRSSGSRNLLVLLVKLIIDDMFNLLSIAVNYNYVQTRTSWSNANWSADQLAKRKLVRGPVRLVKRKLVRGPGSGFLDTALFQCLTALFVSWQCSSSN